YLCQSDECPYAGGAPLGRNLSRWRSRPRVSQLEHKLLDLTPFALYFLLQPLGRLLKSFEFLARLYLLPDPLVSLAQAVMRLVHPGTDFDRLLVRGDGVGVVVLAGVYNAQLQISG